MSEQSSKKPLQRLFIILLSLPMLGFLIIPLSQIFQSPSPSSQASPQQTASSEPLSLEQVKAEEQRALEILKQEPENPAALVGLVKARLAQSQIERSIEPLKGTIEPLEKLVKLDPQNEQIKALLAQIKQLTSESIPARPNSSPEPQKNP
jgi:cytochrome c-type biogenesis protein CcmH/NrfG